MNVVGFHSRIADLQRRLETLPDTLADCIDYNKDELLQLRKDEILLGRDSDGHPFTPGYTEDPYFKSKHAANAYADYKHSIESIQSGWIEHTLNYAPKDSNTPNLRQTRRKYNPLSFQDQMFIQAGRESFIIGSTFREAHLIDAKYNRKVYPIGPLAKEYFWRWILLQWLRNHLYRVSNGM